MREFSPDAFGADWAEVKTKETAVGGGGMWPRRYGHSAMAKGRDNSMILASWIRG